MTDPKYSLDSSERQAVDRLLRDRPDQVNRRVQIRPEHDYQRRIDKAGKNGVLDWAPGVYYVDSALMPRNRQTHNVGRGVRFRPAGDNTVWDLTGKSNVCFQGAHRIEDPDNNSQSVPAMLWDETIHCYWDRLWFSGVWRGLRTKAVNDGTKGNVVLSFHAEAIRERAMMLVGQTHDNHFPVVRALGAPGSDSGILVNTSGIDGGNMFGLVLSLGFDVDGFKVATLHREIWVQAGIFDVNGGHGLNFHGDGNRSSFFGFVWGGGNGLTGIRVSGTSTDPIDELMIGRAYTIGNAAEGTILEYTNNCAIGMLHSENNDDGFSVKNGTSNDLWVGYLRTVGNTNNAVNGLDAGGECHIGRLNPDVGALTNLSNFTSVNGDAMPEDLTGRTGLYEGERRYHNGANGTNTNRAEPAVWTGADWEGEISGTVIA